MASNNLDIIRAMEMVKAGSSPNEIRDASGFNILTSAILDRNLEAMKLFLDAGADPYLDFMSDHYPRISAVQAVMLSDNPLLPELLSHPRVKDLQNPLSHALMHVVAGTGSPAEMVTLAKMGSPVECLDARGQRPIERAMKCYLDAGTSRIAALSALQRVRALLALGAQPLEVSPKPDLYFIESVHTQMMAAMKSGRLYNAVRTYEPSLVRCVMEELAAHPERANPADEKQALKWIKTKKMNKDASEIVELIEGFYPALKARKRIETIAAGAKTAVGLG